MNARNYTKSLEDSSYWQMNLVGRYVIQEISIRPEHEHCSGLILALQEKTLLFLIQKTTYKRERHSRIAWNSSDTIDSKFKTLALNRLFDYEHI